MTPPFPCGRFEREMLARLVRGEEVDEAHLEDCHPCARARAQYERLLDLLPDALALIAAEPEAAEEPADEHRDVAISAPALEPAVPLPARAWWGVAALVAAAAVLGFLLSKPRTGKIVVGAADVGGAALDHVEIVVDGKTRCESVPCEIDALPAGPHDVRVVAEGYVSPGVRLVPVAPSRESQVDFALVAERGGLRVTSEQEGVRLVVDGKEIGPVPQEMHDLTPGDHVVRLVGSPRYEPREWKVTSEHGWMIDLGSPVLGVRTGKLKIILGTAGAKVWLATDGERHEFPRLPVTVDVDAYRLWALEASKPGFVDFRQLITFDDGAAEKTIRVELEPVPVRQDRAYEVPPGFRGFPSDEAPGIPVEASAPDSGAH